MNEGLSKIHDYLGKHEWEISYRHEVCDNTTSNMTIRKCKTCWKKEREILVVMLDEPGDVVWEPYE